MKLTLPQSLLAESLGAVRHAAGKSSLPVLSHVAIKTFDKSVEFVCSDLDMTLRRKVDADVQATGACTVRCSLFHDIVKSFPSKEGAMVHLELIKNDLHVRCGESKYQLSTLPWDEFPAAVKLKSAAEFQIPQADLRLLLGSTAYAQGKDESRFILCGSLVQLNGQLSVACTDGRRLALASGECPKDSPKTEVILPAQCVAELLHLLSADNEKPVTIALGSTQEAKDKDAKDAKAKKKSDKPEPADVARFQIGDITLTSKVIDGTYPNYRQVIPEVKGAGVPIGRVDLLAAVERLAMVGDSVELEFRRQTLSIRSHGNKANELLGSGIETLLIPKTDDLKVKLSARYLVDALSATDADEIQFHCAPDSVCLIKVAGKSWLSVIAPQRDDGVKPAAKPASTQ